MCRLDKRCLTTIPSGTTTTPPLRAMLRSTRRDELARVARSSEYGEGDVVAYKNHLHCLEYLISYAYLTNTTTG